MSSYETKHIHISEGKLKLKEDASNKIKFRVQPTWKNTFFLKLDAVLLQQNLC